MGLHHLVGGNSGRSRMLPVDSILEKFSEIEPHQFIFLMGPVLPPYCVFKSDEAQYVRAKNFLQEMQVIFSYISEQRMSRLGHRKRSELISGIA